MAHINTFAVLPEEGRALSPGRMLARAFWKRLLLSHHIPDPGQMPGHLHVPSRVWKRHSSLLMSLYDNKRGCK